MVQYYTYFPNLEERKNKIYELSGKPVSYDDLAKTITAVTGKEVTVQHVDDATYTGY